MNNESRIKKYMKITLLVFSKNLFYGGNWLICAYVGLNNGVLEGRVVIILSRYSSCWYIFYHWYLKKKDRDLGYNSRCQLLSSDYGVEHSQKMSCFQGGFEVLLCRWRVTDSMWINFLRRLQVLLQAFKYFF